MTAKINYLNIGIIVILIISGVFVSFNDGQRNKAAVAESVNTIGDFAQDAMPVGSLQDAMPAMTYDSVNNSMVITSGLTILCCFIIVMAIFLLYGTMGCMSAFSRM